MAKYASTLLNVAKSWLGYNESDGSHKKILEVYNAHKPLARGYKVQPKDEWCATFVSACSIKANMTDIIPTECSCQKQIELFKQKGTWVENENCVPKAGWVIYYDWQDDGKGDNKGWSDHVGIVESCDGTNIVVIEGNCNEAVKRRNIKVNGKYIRGYGAPKFDKEPEKETSKPIKRVFAKDSAKGFDKALAGTYKTTSGLHLRHGAGITEKSMIVIPKGTTVNNYGYYTSVLGTKWLYIQVTLDGIQYIGFSSSRYLKK